MSDESPFADFSSEQPQQTFDEDQPMALPPPTEGSGGMMQPQEDDDELEEQTGERDAPQEDSFGLSSPPAAASGETSDPFATVDGGSTENAGAFDSFSGAEPEVKEEEAAALKNWERERAEVLRTRAAKAEADKAAALSTAKEEVSKFYADRESSVTKASKTNRADEKNYRADMKATFESGQRWEKVNKLISTQPKPANDKSANANNSRVDRMRKLLIQLKTEKKK